MDNLSSVIFIPAHCSLVWTVLEPHVPHWDVWYVPLDAAVLHFLVCPSVLSNLYSGNTLSDEGCCRTFHITIVKSALQPTTSWSGHAQK
mmetsp:Transcript_15851/g.35688  ORF Transcript_15851/g.35688 Transcript_15851/m.35688 type:complete len:89 (-) Transcript_15851:84-350(-)